MGIVFNESYLAREGLSQPSAGSLKFHAIIQVLRESYRTKRHHVQTLLRANVELADTGIVVRNFERLASPCVDMNVLKFGSIFQAVAYEHVVKLLHVHVESSRIALNGRCFYHVIHVEQARYLCEAPQRSYKFKLIKVARNNDSSVGVLL